MWICNKCGSKNFVEKVVSGAEWVEYDKNGEIVDYGDIELNFGDTICRKYGYTGKKI